MLFMFGALWTFDDLNSAIELLNSACIICTKNDKPILVWHDLEKISEEKSSHK